MRADLDTLFVDWFGAVLINLTVWLLVGLGNGAVDSFWPMWPAIPGLRSAV